MKKALIDQMMLGLFIFFALIAIGATVDDVMKARDKFYNLKRITDNSVLTMAKYYSTVSENTTNAEAINYDMMSQTALGMEVRDLVTYSWDFVSEPNTVTATIDNYDEDTFWFKFLGFETFTLKAESRATITTVDLPTATSDYSAGLSPFAVNEQTFTIGAPLNLTYEITADWQYSDKNTFYPVLTNCDCDCDFALSNKFDFSDLGFDMQNCDNTSVGCTTHGESEFSHYARQLDDIYESSQSINFENGKTDSPICLLGTYLGNTKSTWNTQINHLTNGINDLVGANGSNLPMEMDILTLDSGAIANGIVRLRIDNIEVKKTGNSDTRYINLSTTIVPAKSKEVDLVY